MIGNLVDSVGGILGHSVYGSVHHFDYIRAHRMERMQEVVAILDDLLYALSRV